ncbi:hypothetical protein SAMN00777080_1667 [Aquiflexum balticum DSM 16537]|uniref:Uncharacterized protein n=1 Tax=Aquiflexum balticum DSM 16537 TaxID=758820 RepID=A0A1W2H2D0_9BACT|nr:hypothetical protein [Aquiflexum balticum]SMD43090.1 hypothetical protein SAMN00777080_1667 [Aquiflexum balticum DSM 16537]
MSNNILFISNIFNSSITINGNSHSNYGSNFSDLLPILQKWSANNARIFSILEEEWEDDEAQVSELLKLKQESEDLQGKIIKLLPGGNQN